MDPIRLPPEKMASLESAIPFHRSSEEPTAPDAPLITPFEDEPTVGEQKPKKRPADAEPYRKKYKKYGRDVVLPGESDPYDVLMDDTDTSHHGVDNVSPL